MSPKKKVLFVSQEITPYLKNSPMGTEASGEAAQIAQKGYEVRMFMPKYGCINERRNQLHEVIRLCGLNIAVDDTDHPLIIKVATQQESRLQVYFIDNDDYFHHHAVTDIELREDPVENDERLIFFSRGVAETVKKLRWPPVLIQCMGWASSLLPLYLKTIYAKDATLGAATVVVALYNDSFEGGLDPRLRDKLLQDGFTAEQLQALPEEGAATWTDLCHAAIDAADGVVVADSAVPAELLEYASAKGKKIFPYRDSSDPQWGDALVEFYDTL